MESVYTPVATSQPEPQSTTPSHERERVRTPEMEKWEIALKSVPEFIRPVLMEQEGVIRGLQQECLETREPQTLKLDVGAYRFIALSFHEMVPPHLQRQLTSLMNEKVHGWTLQQGEKFTTLTHHADNALPLLKEFHAQAIHIMADAGIKIPEDRQPFWMSIGKPDAHGHIKITALPPQDSKGKDSKLLIYQALTVTPEAVLFPSTLASSAVGQEHKPWLAPLAEAVRSGEALPILTQTADDPTIGERTEYTSNKKNTRFSNISALATNNIAPADSSIDAPYDISTWDEYAKRNQDVLENMAIGQSPYTLKEVREQIRLSDSSIENVLVRATRRRSDDTVPESMRDTQEIVFEPNDILFTVDISGMTAITDELEKSFARLNTDRPSRPQEYKRWFTDMREKAQDMKGLEASVRTFFSEWLESVASKGHQHGLSPFELAGDGMSLLSDADNQKNNLHDFMPPALRFLSSLSDIANSWEKLLWRKSQTGSMDEQFAAMWIQEMFGKRVFLKIGLAKTSTRLSLIPSGSHAVTVFMESKDDQALSLVHKETKKLNPKVISKEELSEEEMEKFFVDNHIRILGGVNQEFISKIEKDINQISDLGERDRFIKMIEAFPIITYQVGDQQVFLVTDIPVNRDRFVESFPKKNGAYLLELQNINGQLRFSNEPALERKRMLDAFMDTFPQPQDTNPSKEGTREFSKTLMSEPSGPEAGIEALRLIHESEQTGLNILDEASAQATKDIYTSTEPTLILNQYVQNRDIFKQVLQDLLLLTDRDGHPIIDVSNITIFSKESMVERKGWGANVSEEEDIKLDNKRSISGTRETCMAIRFPQGSKDKKTQQEAIYRVASQILGKTSILHGDRDTSLEKAWVVSDIRVNNAFGNEVDEYAHKENVASLFDQVEVYSREVGRIGTKKMTISTLIHPKTPEEIYTRRRSELEKSGYKLDYTCSVNQDLAAFALGESS